MRKILKYDIPIESEFEIEFPCESDIEGPRILKVSVHYGVPKMWVAVSGDQKVKLKFQLVATGEEIPYMILDYGLVDTGDTYVVYIDTIFIDGFVYHLFQIETA